MSTNCKRLFVAGVIVAAASAALYRPRTVHAQPEFFDKFKELYPEAAGSKLTQAPPSATCALTCHRAGYGTEHHFSRYALDFNNKRLEHLADPTWTIDQTFAALEELDSDGDGTSNVDEITVSQTYPGDPNDRPLSAAAVTTTAAVESDVAESTPGDNAVTLATAVVNTASGTPVSVLPQDAATGLSPVTLTFSSVAQPGNTVLMTSGAGPALPVGFELGTPPLYYELTTEVPYSPPVAICIHYPHSAFADTSDLRLLHYEAGAWVDVTTSVDTLGEVACGSVSSLSPFVVAQWNEFGPPVTTAVASAHGWTNAAGVTVQLSASPGRGGTPVKEILFALGGAQVGSGVIPGAAGTLDVTAEGKTTVSFFARDERGNTEDAHAIQVHIDRTPPHMIGLPAPGCTLSPADGRLVTVANVSAADTASGVASLTVTARSSEPMGKGLPDIVITGGVVQLRAERSGTAPRIYTIDAIASDQAGNVSSASATCMVPRARP